MSPETIQQVQQVLSLIHTGVVDLGSSFLVGHLIYRTVKSEKTDKSGKTDRGDETVKNEDAFKTEDSRRAKSSSGVIGEQQKNRRPQVRRAPHNKNLEEPTATKITEEKQQRSQTRKARGTP